MDNTQQLQNDNIPAAQKKYYWIKLNTGFFNRAEIDFLLAQKNGCEYIVLYQMLCLNTANNDGQLSSKIGDMIIRFDPDKIARDTKYFDIDTVIVALELYKKLGLIYEGNDQILQISHFDEMVGSEVSSAKRVREYRERQKQIALQCNNDVTQEIEKEIELDIELNNLCVSVSEADASAIKEIIGRFELKDPRTQGFLIKCIKAGMKTDIINNALMIPFDRNVRKLYEQLDEEGDEMEEYTPAILNPTAYSITILENWLNFGVKDIEDVKKYNKILKCKK